MPDNRVITHYGVKGQKWGVRRYRSKASRAGAVVRKGLVGSESHSLATVRGRKNLKSNVKADVSAGKKAVNKLLNNKVFKALIFNKDTSVLTAAGRKELSRSMKLKEKVKSFEKKQLKEQQSDITKLKKQGKTKEAAGLQKEIDDVYGKDLSPWED